MQSLHNREVSRFKIIVDMSTPSIDSLANTPSVETGVRFATGLALAAAITYFLLWAMQALVATGDQTIMQDRDHLALDFVRVQRDEKIQHKRNKPDKPPPPIRPPSEPPKPKLDDINPSVEKIAVNEFPVETDVNLSTSGFSLGVGEGDFLPLAKVSPIYPQRALRRGIEGYCTVQYTVTATGATKDIVVVKDQCTSRLFHNASVEAAKKFKYRPRVRDGKALEVPGVRNKFTYQLER